MVAFCASLVAAQAQPATSRPAATLPAAALPPTWPQAVAKLSDAVRGKDLTSLAAVLERGPIIRTFGSETLVAPERLLGATTGSTLLGCHAYMHTPATLASDLVEDFKRAGEVSENIRRDMIPGDEPAEKRANEIAAQWVTQVLQPDRNQPVGIIVLWRQDRSDTFTSSGTRPLFLVVKGDLQDGQYVFNQVTFGDPLEAKN